MILTLKQHVDHWVSSSIESLLDMEAAVKSKRRMNALYCGHLSVEKMFKALLAARDTQIIWKHDLLKLAAMCGLVLNSGQEAELDTLNQFNLAAKYSSVKSKIYALCTPQYTDTWAANIRKWHKFLKKQVIGERAALPNNKAATYPEDRF